MTVRMKHSNDWQSNIIQRSDGLMFYYAIVRLIDNSIVQTFFGEDYAMTYLIAYLDNKNYSVLKMEGPLPECESAYCE